MPQWRGNVLQLQHIAAPPRWTEDPEVEAWIDEQQGQHGPWGQEWWGEAEQDLEGDEDEQLEGCEGWWEGEEEEEEEEEEWEEEEEEEGEEEQEEGEEEEEEDPGAHAPLPTCQHCGVVPPLSKKPPRTARGEDHYPQTVWAPVTLETDRLRDRDMRIPKLPAGLPAGQIDSNRTRLCWINGGKPDRHCPAGKKRKTHRRARTDPRASTDPPFAEKWPVLLMTRGDNKVQAELANAMGATTINCASLGEHEAWQPHRGCCGESGAWMHPASMHKDLPGIFAAAAKSIYDQWNRPGGAVLCLADRTGYRGSVSAGVFLHRFLKAAGWTVELRHIGSRSTTTCRCIEGGTQRQCPEVLRRLPGGSAVQAAALYRDHLKQQEQAFQQAYEVFREAFTGWKGMEVRV